ncbi:cobalt/nickel transport system permease protein [Methanobrevibacter gottschalkii]|uniref:Cobalt/nickel transport system permease protein n=2 Tax=Methanobrevibacter gottschalkii TaxID=190974 RepID=A0A3N5C945_9EURY|nr:MULTISPECIES: cobalt ECF transporter T component CbiQ [Methanobrevibacter]OEC95386.1 cobalt ECF transporter T component CbiQ [Methanobrevibacter sp. A27]RPF53131.1 cobalt/nickel transport system permease protein [Methanobrevibacter gottschalkii DSM 11977]SEK61967.1 cobalt/nickel transport system permease protein [Methanobrevibacter gottschalkii]
MVDITQIMRFDELSSQNSPIHNLEGRIKLITTIFIILVSVISKELFIPIILEIILLNILKIADLSYINSAKRLLMLLPFGGAIIVFQPFIQPGNIIWSYSWLHITDFGLNWAILLLVRMIVCLTAIIIYSSTTPLQEMASSFRKLKMPRDLAMILSIMVRFLFLFVDELAAIRKSQKSRNFNIHSKNTTYKWRVKQVGYTIGMMFLKSYEQGERVHKSMVSRGFSDTSEMFDEKKSPEKSDYIFIISIIIVVIILEIIMFKYSGQLGYFGQNLSIN